MKSKDVPQLGLKPRHLDVVFGLPERTANPERRGEGNSRFVKHDTNILTRFTSKVKLQNKQFLPARAANNLPLQRSSIRLCSFSFPSPQATYYPSNMTQSSLQISRDKLFQQNAPSFPREQTHLLSQTHLSSEYTPLAFGLQASTIEIASSSQDLNRFFIGLKRTSGGASKLTKPLNTNWQLETGSLIVGLLEKEPIYGAVWTLKV
ncbi:LAME_0A01970g1_1 [Lachancea meyersii CBS 8951]|uniref:LAME_0A01970g1_1 n=1 Tax=Lachancea meyersii CBS 8951 TaxID=1266667 RepID=A0A1G4IM90_9SACH|nr:LAME_0A01970g1_1 [Lachancea meyersii CBS 8951]